MTATTTPATQELYKLLLKSEKFLNWKPESEDRFNLSSKQTDRDLLRTCQSAAAEKHFTPQELADNWGVSAETIRITFREEPGVLRLVPSIRNTVLAASVSAGL
jgi:hypothetical protein